MWWSTITVFTGQRMSRSGWACISDSNCYGCRRIAREANPIERAFGDVHDKCTRNHQRKRIDDLVDDIKWHLKKNGPWRYKLSDIYYDREIENEVKKLKKQDQN